MSRIGKQPVIIPNGVTVEINGHSVTVKGSKGELKKTFHPNIKIEVNEGKVQVIKPDETKFNNSLHGLTRTLISNMIDGVSKGFEKRLEIIGVGYRAQTSGNKITLSLGYSHPIEYKAPDHVTFEMDAEAKNVIIIKGIDKEVVGQVAAIVRSYRKPEPYKGKGIKYIDERVKRKAGKTAAK